MNLSGPVVAEYKKRIEQLKEQITNIRDDAQNLSPFTERGHLLKLCDYALDALGVIFLNLESGTNISQHVLQINQAVKQISELYARIGKMTPREKKEIAPEIAWIKTGVTGFDDLLEKGIPKGSAILIAGGAGSGKTIFALQTVNYGASNGEKCLYISFEESEKNLKKHMRDFGMDHDELERKGLLKIKQANAFDISTSVEALLAKAKGELMIELDEIPGLFPEGFKPDRVVLDSLSALAAAFSKRDETYRTYIEQLFRYFEKKGVTSFLISETEQLPTRFSESGVEEFLADGVIVLYNVRKSNIRENAIEILKLRGAKHQKKIVALQITDKGIVVYPEQEVFGGLKEKT